MQLKQQFNQAVSNILSAKLRSFLAILGILVGTASVVTLVISGQLATQKALDQFKALGTDLLSISLYEKKPSQTITPANTLSMAEWLQLEYEIPEIIESAPYITMYSPITYLGHKIEGAVIGADKSLKKVIKIKLESGHFVSFVDHYEQYCVIGQKIKKQMERLHYAPVIGKRIWVGDNIYKIIGVAEQWLENSFFNEDVNKSIIIPIRGANIISNSAKINNSIFRIQKGTDIDKLTLKINQFINKHAPELSSFPRSAKQIIKSMEQQGKIFTLLLGLIGGISLLVGGIGVMNVMLVSVVERKKEIGIRKAIGAKRRDIQKLFLIESIVLSLFGGTLGVISGLGIAYIICIFSGWNFQLYLEPPLVGFTVSVATGIFFGFYPALRAARLNPIETLRYD